MSVATEVAIAVACVSVLLAIACGSLLLETKIKHDYKIEALEATQNCETCQLIILSKGD